MRIESPLSLVSSDDLPDTDLLVNVFNGSEKSVVRFRINGGDWQSMDRLEEARSPFFQTLFADYNRNATPTNHIWSSELPELSIGVHRIEVWTRDMYGQEFTQTKVIEVEE